MPDSQRVVDDHNGRRLHSLTGWCCGWFVSGHDFSRAESAAQGGRLQPLRMAIPNRHAETSDIQSNARTFFVTSATLGHRRLLQSERMARLLIQVLYHYRAERKYRLHEFVIMPDHFHVLLTVGSDLTVERAVQFIKGGSAYRAGMQFGLHDLWQRGFSEARVSNAAEYAARRDYTLLNPVRARIVQLSEQFPFSSVQPEYELDPPPFVAIRVGASGGG